MTYDEYFNLVLNSEPEDWLFFDEKNVLTFKHDLNIWIKRIITDERFEEEWAERYPDSRAYKVNVEFYYGNSLVGTDIFVSVDGHRAIVPIVKVEGEEYTNNISRRDYIIARILSQASWVEGRYLDSFNIIDE